MKTIIFVFLVSFATLSFSQEDSQSHKLEYHSFSVNPLLGFYSDFNPNVSGALDTSGSYKDFKDTGLIFGLDVSFSYVKKHLFTLSLYTGTEFNILGTSNGFTQLNLLYGRSYPLSRIVFFEAHVGTGYFNFHSRHIDTERRGQESLRTIGFPVMAKLRVMTGKRFSLGLIFQINVNNIKPIYNTGIILQWNKKK